MSFDLKTGRPGASAEPAPEEPGADTATATMLEPATGLTKWWDLFVPLSMREDPEQHRRARLQVRFGILGAIFGALYAAFYFLVDHDVGGSIIFFCSIVIGTVPKLLQKFENLALTGNLYAALLLAGFTGLCLCERGMSGHAIAWMASIPLCVLMLVEKRSAIAWTILCSGVTAAFGICHMMGIAFPYTYPEKWHSAIDAAGYAGLVPFMAMLGFIFETTRRKAFNRLQATLHELSAANESLVQLNEEKSEFLSIAAHDLKNPLSIICGYSDLLQFLENPSPIAVKEQAREIQTSANRMLDIIKNLLDTRAIEDGHLNLKSELCPLKPLVNQLLSDYSNAAESKRISIKVEGDLKDLALCADNGATHQILDNLLSNAIKYSPMGSPVTIRSYDDRNGNVQIDVIDEGPGLSEEDQGKLFQKFSRLTPRPTGGESSNGLGLWIVHRMAGAMGGTISCKSCIGRGSVFSLHLPMWTDNLHMRNPSDDLALPA